MGCQASSPRGPQKVPPKASSPDKDVTGHGDMHTLAKSFGKKEKEAIKKLGNFFRESSYKLQAKKERTWQVRCSRSWCTLFPVIT